MRLWERATGSAGIAALRWALAHRVVRRLTPGKRFCRACGAAVSDARRYAVGGSSQGGRRELWRGGSGEPVAERRVCSVLFVDLVGFTPLSESRDPEEVRELLSEYFDRGRGP